tara:strand:+ start:215 stop:967 length:753 start_codon:yes stop_codon:yes gene_type:complete
VETIPYQIDWFGALTPLQLAEFRHLSDGQRRLRVLLGHVKFEEDATVAIKDMNIDFIRHVGQTHHQALAWFTTMDGLTTFASEGKTDKRFYYFKFKFLENDKINEYEHLVNIYYIDTESGTTKYLKNNTSTWSFMCQWSNRSTSDYNKFYLKFEREVEHVVYDDTINHKFQIIPYKHYYKHTTMKIIHLNDNENRLKLFGQSRTTSELNHWIAFDIAFDPDSPRVLYKYDLREPHLGRNYAFHLMQSMIT